MTDSNEQAERDEEHGWIDQSGFEEVDTDDEIDEGALA